MLSRQCNREDDSSVQVCNVHINYPASKEVHCNSSHAVSDMQRSKQGDLQLRTRRRRATKQEKTRCARKRQILSKLWDRLPLQGQSKESHEGILNAACKTIHELRCILDQAIISDGKRHDRE